MRRAEGRGWLLHTGEDAPYAGWGGVRALDQAWNLATAPWEGLGALARLAGLLPGGFALLWDAPVAWLDDLAPEVRAGYWKLLTQTPGLALHVRDAAFAPHLREPGRVRLQARTAPTGDLGQAWRRGWIGWVPETRAGHWELPGLGTAADAEPPAWLWGELILPLGALEHLDPVDLARTLEEAQARSEKAISLRMEAGAWPGGLPFQRRRTGWRVSFLGGREWQLAGAGWDRAGEAVRALVEALEHALRCPIHPGVSTDPLAAEALGRQAMNEGLPWRSALPLPPAPPSFTPGLGLDPRDPSPLESRCAFPRPLSQLLGPPEAALRVPAVPMEGPVGAFVAGLQTPPALRWLPPEAALPGPFMPDHPWAEAAAFPPPPDTTQVLQPALFEDL
ncbi:hypothetical protein [Mesoterricola sediminis]|uniref:Uncharacterized protein n=1 Tax=Mesoterricola sediminis TaxID=2927980 RepID=A0AA48GU25_9BACT|nr:hypothetical protein [Mesoterricola sediminis]BDU76214.1 hypothetical protein METESE_11720 [Mesoterricola sediminis]